jgi:DNA-binding transcriptional ArsR family regulator
MSDVFEALAPPARRAILDALQASDGQSLFELCSRLTMQHGLAMSRQAISQHLSVLESAGLVVAERRGRCKVHYIDTRPLKAILDRWPERGDRGAGDEDRRDQRVRG